MCLLQTFSNFFADYQPALYHYTAGRMCNGTMFNSSLLYELASVVLLSQKGNLICIQGQQINTQDKQLRRQKHKHRPATLSINL